MRSYELKTVILHITNACTSHCPYCYACAGLSDIAYADSSKIFKIIDILSKNNIERISLLGGDPVLHPDFMKIVKKAKEAGICVGIMSNTMALPVPFVEATKYIDTFETTIHGSSAEIHDTFSKSPGAYSLLTHNLYELSKFNVTIGIAINIIPETAHCIYDLVENLVHREKIRIDYVILQRIVPFGRAAESSEFFLNMDDINNAMIDIDRVAKDFNIDVLVEDPFPLCIIEEEFRKYMAPCEWGYSKAALNGNGDITRCGADPRYLLGNIFETPIKQIWEEAPLLKAFRNMAYLPESCKKCSLVEKCRGGCPLGTAPGLDLGIDYLICCQTK